MAKKNNTTQIKRDILVRYEDGRKELINCLKDKELLDVIKTLVLEDNNCKGAIITKSTFASKVSQVYPKVKRINVDGLKKTIAHA